MISPSSGYLQQAGQFNYLHSFNFASQTPCFTFSTKLGKERNKQHSFTMKFLHLIPALCATMAVALPSWRSVTHAAEFPRNRANKSAKDVSAPQVDPKPMYPNLDALLKGNPDALLKGNPDALLKGNPDALLKDNPDALFEGAGSKPLYPTLDVPDTSSTSLYPILNNAAGTKGQGQ